MNKISSTTNLATTAALIFVGNKIHNVNDLVKQADYDQKYHKWKKHQKWKTNTTSNYKTFTSNTLDSQIFIRQSYFSDNGWQNYLIFQLL